MKASLIIILVAFGLSTSATMRKISVNNPKSLLLAGFFGYHAFPVREDNTITDLITFTVLFIKERNSNSYSNMNLPISVKFKNGTKLSHDTECVYVNNTNEEEALYYCFNYNITNITNITDIESVTPSINFTFYNNESLIDKYTVTEKDIDISSIAKTTIKTLSAFPNNVTVDIFYLEKIILNKSDEFILVRNLSNNYTETNINLTLSGTKYNVSVTDTIKFNATGKIDEHLHGKMEESTENSKYIIIYAEKGVDDHLIYPVSNKKIEVLGFGNYTKPTTNSDAYNHLYITGNQYILNGLKKFIKFYTTIYYNNLRNLEELNTTVEAKGTLIENNQTEGMAIYNITYNGTANKNIMKIDPPSHIEFSENGTNYEIFNDISISPDVDLLQQGTIERMDHFYLTDQNSTSFAFDFNLTDNSNPYDIGTQKDAYLKYHPNNNITKYDEIKCVFQHFSILNRLICFPKKDVYTNINTTKIIINETSSKLRLRALQTETNRTIIPPTDATGVINFTYSNFHSYYKRPKGGLSAGAIVAIVLVTIAAVVALGLAILFLNRMKASPPPVRNPSDVNIANSTSNINN